VHRKVMPQPESDLMVKLIRGIVDEYVKTLRFRPQPPQAALTKRQCATAAGVGLSSIEKAILDGDLDARKLGKRTLIPKAAFDRWLESLPRVPHAGANQRKQASRQRIIVASADRDQRELSPTP
jgi:excisionase family DNA binding protein